MHGRAYRDGQQAGRQGRCKTPWTHVRAPFVTSMPTIAPTRFELADMRLILDTVRVRVYLTVRIILTKGRWHVGGSQEPGRSRHGNWWCIAIKDIVLLVLLQVAAPGEKERAKQCL